MRSANRYKKRLERTQAMARSYLEDPAAYIWLSESEYTELLREERDAERDYARSHGLEMPEHLEDARSPAASSLARRRYESANSEIRNETRAHRQERFLRPFLDMIQELEKRNNSLEAKHKRILATEAANLLLAWDIEVLDQLVGAAVSAYGVKDADTDSTERNRAAYLDRLSTAVQSHSDIALADITPDIQLPLQNMAHVTSAVSKLEQRNKQLERLIKRSVRVDKVKTKLVEISAVAHTMLSRRPRIA